MCILRKRFALSILLFFSSFFGFSQDKSAYNALSIPLELKSNANAIIRYENKVVEIVSKDEIKVVSKRVTTVLNKYGNRHINAVQFYDKHTKIEKMIAYIYDEFGNEIKKVKERDFKDVSAVSQISIYEDDRVKYLDYTPLNYPYTVEYNYEVIYKNTAFFPNWLPINDYYLSTQHSEFKIVNNASIELKTKKENFEFYPITEVSDNHFIASNIEGIKQESYTPGLNSIVPRFRVALKAFNMLGVEGINNNWSDFGKWMYDRLLTGTDNIPQTTINEVKQLTSGVDDKIERAKLVYKYMQDKTRYISIQVGIGGWKPMIAEEVDALGYSDCKGLSNYTKALLEAVNVPSYYTVIYGGRSIRHIDSEFSAIQGNHVILCIPDEEENIFLECTSQTNPFGFIAGFTDDRTALLVKPEGGEIVHTKIYSAEDNLQETTADIILNDTGGFEADVVVETTGFQYHLHEGLENETQRDQQLHYKEYWDNINNLSIEKIALENDKENIVYSEKVKLSSSSYASKSGNRLILQPNMFNKVSKIPTRYTDRKLDFKIDRSFKDTDEFIIQLPQSFQLEVMSEGKSIESKFGSYQFKLEAIGENQIKYTRTYTLLKGAYDKEEYKAFRDFRKQIVKYDKTKIVLVKT
ncbi:DUF3857 domain-containing transglutaminase family protein [Winogradskyella sp.]|uniref:DUF3857 domain-containing transglutaminase family protein n=1 Tax=Winogradskyella sp. TaxID=1883156 RepID=UPI00260C0934|nr:DUF3857 domain-containing transglutaminase family protein [Winogradskyella sp.]